ncbi:MAG: nucleotide pyrophosphohydrolase [Fermentimonas sp.]|nr:nucleotide pyrophosphohydrolase [Fermentimonas sp.]MDD4008806.1 nucleotide pyrophosphohydrolase [Fermentimonas sp.]MDD4696459.1 nucleotide pyrophosphohydrolase [Fermentimonas sp.]
MTIREAQSKVDEWIKMYGVRYFGELTNMTLLTEEVGELARVMARTYGEQSSKESDLSKNMSEEIGDILWVLICIANQTGVNLEESFLSSIEKKTKRDATRHLNNDKLKS